MTERETALLAGCLRGEKAAWDTFVLQYSDLVYHTIKRTLVLYHVEPRSDLLEDLHQDVFVIVLKDDFRKLRQFKGDRGCTLASWLRVVTSRLTIDYLRTRKPSNIELTDSLAAEQSDPPDSLIDREEEIFLSRTLGDLSSHERILIDLFYVRGLSPEDIASILKISVNAFYTQKSRLLDKLRETLRKTGSL